MWQADRGLTAQWHAVTVAVTLSAMVADEKPDNLSAAQLELVDALTSSLTLVPAADLAGDHDAWVAALKPLMPYVYVALCDEDVCDAAIAVLHTFFRVFPDAALQVRTARSLSLSVC
jgi:hypothetical protein